LWTRVQVLMGQDRLGPMQLPNRLGMQEQAILILIVQSQTTTRKRVSIWSLQVIWCHFGCLQEDSCVVNVPLGFFCKSSSVSLTCFGSQQFLLNIGASLWS
jgi:hypothetical protein